MVDTEAMNKKYSPPEILGFFFLSLDSDNWDKREIEVAGGVKPVYKINFTSEPGESPSFFL